jgi:hypothetical protein
VSHSTSQAARSGHRTTARPTQSAGNDRVLERARILEELSELLESGQVDVEEVLKSRYPDAYDDLRALLPTLEVLSKLKEQESR